MYYLPDGRESKQLYVTKTDHAGIAAGATVWAYRLYDGATLVLETCDGTAVELDGMYYYVEGLEERNLTPTIWDKMNEDISKEIDQEVLKEIFNESEDRWQLERWDPTQLKLAKCRGTLYQALFYLTNPEDPALSKDDLIAEIKNILELAKDF